MNGIGTEINKMKGFESFNDAAGKGNNDVFDENVDKFTIDINKVYYWSTIKLHCINWVNSMK